jgi:hypothetical protein
MAPHAQQEAKKRKHADQGDDVASKKSRMTVLNATPRSEFSAFSEVSIRLYIHLAPMWVNKPIEGVNEQLNAFLMKYVQSLLFKVIQKSAQLIEFVNLGTFLKLTALLSLTLDFVWKPLTDVLCTTAHSPISLFE